MSGKSEAFSEKINILQRANIQISAHTIDGWKSQYALMMRFYNRAQNASDKTDKLDYWISFFQNCFYIKDWIKNQKRNESIDWKKRLNNLINNNQEMQICRDICNGTKHLVLNHASIDKHFAIFYEHNPWHQQTNEPKSEWKIFINGKKYKMSKLANECIQIWNLFLIEEKLIEINTART